MEEEKDDEVSRPLLSMDDIMRFSQINEGSGYGTSENLRNLLQKGGQKFFDLESPKRETVADTWPGLDHNAMAPYIQSILMGGLGLPVTKPDGQNQAAMVPEIMRILGQDPNILKEQLMKNEHLNNGKQIDPSDEEGNKVRAYSRQSSSAGSVITKNDRATPLTKNDSPDDGIMEVDQISTGDPRDSPTNVILKIPSFKPLGPGSNSGKNGGETFPGAATSPLPYFSHSPRPEGGLNSGPRSTSPLASQHHLNKSIFSLRDVIAKSISQKFQQHTPPLPNSNNDINRLKVSSPNIESVEGLNVFKRGGLTPPSGTGQGISVIKNLASHDLTRNFSSNTNNNSNNSNQSQQNNSTGGKGTRPKRGKYRNYDRDSLVEAVKAVQRGEMSVHRAGSYYGVPHSTLEYKVKERHLMRPRKREPKNPNPDDKTTTTSVTNKPQDTTSALRQERNKPVQKPAVSKPNFPSPASNGLKMPMFEGGLPMGYNPSPFPFWTPGLSAPGFPGTSAAFPPNPAESYFASQMMQKLHDMPGGRKPGDLPPKNEGHEGSQPASSTPGDGSLLEGIIRSTLEEGGRRLRPDDLLLAEEMREAARRIRARESTAPTVQRD